MPADTSREKIIILASTSPYRRELLGRIGVDFVQEAPGTDEQHHPGESPADMVSRLAREKAQAVAARHKTGIVIGSDQCAVRDGIILGKPGSVENAVQQLEAASGKTVRFLTAVCLVDAANGEIREYLDETVVKFRELGSAEIHRYIDREQPLDCAGSFKSEALGITLFDRIDSSDPTALMGLPLIAVCRMLRHAGVILP